MKKTAELSLLTPVKALAMLLVVAIHSTAMWVEDGWFCEPAVSCPLLGVISSLLGVIAVPLFVFCSGYLYAYLKMETNKYTSSKLVIKKKTMRLVVPYLFACAVWVVPWHVFFNGTQAVVSKYVLMQSPSQLWFLVMLFEIFLLVELTWKPFWSKFLNGHLIAGFVVVLILFFSSYLIGKFIGGTFQIQSTLRYFIFFYFGCTARILSTERFWRINPVILVVGALVAFSVEWIMPDESLVWQILNFIWWPVVRVLSFLAVISCVGGVAKGRVLAKGRIASSLVSCSFGIYLFHQQLIQVMLSLFNVPSMPPILLAVLCFVVALGLSWLIVAVLRRWKITRILIGG